MKKQFIFIFLLVCSLFCSVDAVPPKTQELFLTEEGKFQEPLIQLLQLSGLYDPQDSLKDVVAKTQQHWIAVRAGMGGKERTDLHDSVAQQNQVTAVEALARQMGLLDAKMPSLTHYDYGVCLGSFLDGVRMRLAMLVDLWQKGIHFDTLVFLTGERDLRSGVGQIESLDQLCNPSKSPLPFKKGWKLPEGAPYATEYDMVRLVWEQVELPDEMAKALTDKVIFVNALRGDKPRVTTSDTYITWLKQHLPKPGTIVAPSHPLVWTHQDLVGKNVLGESFTLDTIAPAVPEKMLTQYRTSLVSLVHDTVAKCLYEINEKSTP